MKAKLIVDSLGPNPEFNPPVRKDFLGPNADENFADAKSAYDVSPELLVPAGTILTGAMCWVHCFPDQHGIAFRRDQSTGKVVPYRKSPGVVRAVPADSFCQAEFDSRAAASAASRGVPLQTVLDEVAAAVKRSQTVQAQAHAKEKEQPAAVAQPAVDGAKPQAVDAG